jgi:hypothetical protein
MVESAYLRKGDDLSELLPMHEPGLGRILAEREVSSRAVVVVCYQNSSRASAGPSAEESSRLPPGVSVMKTAHAREGDHFCAWRRPGLAGASIG